MKKPPGLSDEEWGKILAEMALGPLSEPPSPRALLFTAGVIAIIILLTFFLK